MQLIEAMATDRARRVNTKFGERTVIDAVRRDTGEKVTVWRSGDDVYSQKHVIRNARLTLTLDSKGKYSLVEDANLVSLGQPLPVEPVPVKPVSRIWQVITLLSPITTARKQARVSYHPIKSVRLPTMSVKWQNFINFVSIKLSQLSE